MDIVRGSNEQGGSDDREGVGGDVVAVGTDERRMHVRAYNYWVSLLGGRLCPLIDALDPAGIADFGPNSVLLDCTQGHEDATIRFLGHALREESGTDSSIVRLRQVPPRSLLSRLTDHYLQIIANRAPIGFEAEFVGHRGFPMLYRGILMPFSSDGEAIDYLYGVINWKEVVDTATQSQLAAELTESRRGAPRRSEPAAAWADGPSAALAEPVAPRALVDRLVAVRGLVEAARGTGETSAATYAALSEAYDFLTASESEPAGYAAMLVGAGIAVDPRTPVDALVRLTFGGLHEGHARLLARAHRAGVDEGELVEWIERTAGRPAAAVAPVVVPIAAGDDDYVLLLARAVDAGQVQIVGRVDGDPAMVEQARRRLGH
ncbi:hypothetical protein QLH51_01150 [Sphingomonas sp. 2R-10]|uniref:PAS domain-containing protein n=1 Tax=Sphingomonas sp. 2R-10 TaxID=3045148 RepID=UPI000F76E356|nr:hypothetical protein [Sphingomonas sp. 2R-10]MDJ0275413.1 hypothetical protein [Sphingomonas sp. 2R-10]